MRFKVYGEMTIPIYTIVDAIDSFRALDIACDRGVVVNGDATKSLVPDLSESSIKEGNINIVTAEEIDS